MYTYFDTRKVFKNQMDHIPFSFSENIFGFIRQCNSGILHGLLWRQWRGLMDDAPMV